VIGRASRHRGLFLALAGVLAAFAVYSVVAVAVGVTSGSYAHVHVLPFVIAIVLVLALAVLAAWLALPSWRSAMRAPDDPN
jgi:membrane protein implicated in regulation of membrane protease activity